MNLGRATTSAGRWESGRDGIVRWHAFDNSGHDLWGYDADGRHDPRYQRAPQQHTPFYVRTLTSTTQPRAATQHLLERTAPQ